MAESIFNNERVVWFQWNNQERFLIHIQTIIFLELHKRALKTIQILIIRDRFILNNIANWSFNFVHKKLFNYFINNLIASHSPLFLFYILPNFQD